MNIDEKAKLDGSTELFEEIDHHSPKHTNDKKTKYQKKIEALSFVDHLNNWRYDFNLGFLPQTRREYHDPTDKFKTSIPKIDPPFNQGHNIW